ncbi:MAG: hypothetical protein V4731_15050 [Pseudomonadota bacterium]
MHKEFRSAGLPLPRTDSSVQRIREAAGLTWSVLSSPITYAPRISGALATVIPIEGHQVLYRSDTQQQLAIVPSSHTPQQPDDVIDFYLAVAKFYDMPLTRVGCTQGGRTLWGLIATGYGAKFVGKRSGSTFILLTTSCDSRLAARASSLCILDPGDLAVPAAVRPHPTIRMPRVFEFLTPPTLADMGDLIAECIGFPEFLKDLAALRVSNEDVKHAVQRMYGGVEHEGRRAHLKLTTDAVLARFNAQAARRRGTALDLLYGLAQHMDAQDRRRHARDALHAMWLGSGARRRQLAIAGLRDLLLTVVNK